MGVIHAESPHPVWARAIEILETGVHGAIDTALLGYEKSQHHDEARSRSVVGLRALVHGHWPVKDVDTTFNRWNIDTGAGSPSGRLSLLEVNAKDLPDWTFDVDES